jgi:hypothetical protein
MMKRIRYASLLKQCVLAILLALPVCAIAQQVKVVTNHVGYEFDKPKHAILVAESKITVDGFKLMDAESGKVVFTGKAAYSGPVDKWKHWQFYTIDFSSFNTIGNYKLVITLPQKTVSSFPFAIGKNLLEQKTISEVVYYFKGQRSSGLLDRADRTLTLSGKGKDTIDMHGGWYDATGDYGKHLSHLSFSVYFNPQQISLTDWSLFKTYELLNARTGTDYRQFNRRILDEAMYGADYLVRLQVKDGSFYRSVGAPGPGKLPKDRVVQPDEGSYRIKVNKNQSFTKTIEQKSLRSYLASYRSGGGLAIASLAMASAYPTSGEFRNADYLKAAENAFVFLEKQNAVIDYDGKENILDDYCALAAATELYKTTHKDVYKTAAVQRADNLIARLAAWDKYKNYWRADDKDRPYFHPSDAGMPVVSLLEFYPLASEAMQQKIKAAVKSSLQFELGITHEVNNPFGYSRQLVQDTLGNRRSTFFFPHGSDASPWWQGENARLSSIATAAKMAAALFKDDKPFHDQLQSFALDQLNWILGLNPFDASMLQGTGHNNPAYGFFGTFEYTNAPGGIVNGITSGFEDEHDIDFNIPYAVSGKDSDWRWAEQWLPHAAWYLLAVATP